MVKSHSKSPITIPDNELQDINIFGLHGRLLHLESKKDKTILFLSGQHSAHERSYAIAKFLNDYGEVYSPDLPGFGGMDSFYKIHREPNYDAYADYLYEFINTYNLDKITVFATSFSSQCITRMLQKYPSSLDKMDDILFFVGFGSGSDFDVSKWYKTWINFIIYPTSTKLGAKLMQWIAFNPVSLWLMVRIFSLSKAKMQSDKDNLKRDMIDMEAYLWEINDHQTHAQTAKYMFKDDLRNYSNKKIDTNIINITTDDDQYFNNDRVAETFKDLYVGYDTHPLNLNIHAPSLIAEKEEVDKMMSEQTKKLLAS